jgi:hypothetical protein
MARLSLCGRTLSALLTEAYCTEGICPPVPVLIPGKTTPGKRPVPCRINQYPAIVDSDAAGQMMGNRETDCQLAKLRRVLKIRVIPEEVKSDIDNGNTWFLGHLRQQVMLGSAVPPAKHKDLFPRSFWVDQENCERLRNIADILGDGDHTIIEIQTCSLFPCIFH